MWGRNRKRVEGDKAAATAPSPLKEAVREARVEAAERTGVIVDLRDAELARLELLNDALDPLFSEVANDIELFDRGLSRGSTPRLWLDAIAHVEMGRDKRIYRFVQDTRYGRKVIAESYEVAEVVPAVTKYVARRLVERERALAGDSSAAQGDLRNGIERRRRGRTKTFLLGLLCGVALLFAVLWVVALAVY